MSSLGITAAPRQALPDYSSSGGPIQHHFSPYNDNGGTTAAIAGEKELIFFYFHYKFFRETTLKKC